MLEEAIVLGGESRVGVVTARSLAEKGVNVTIVATSSWSPGLHSRACSERVVVTSPEKSIEAYLEELLRLFNRRQGAIVFPVSDIHLMPIAGNWERVSSLVKIGSAQVNSLEIAWDKWQTLEMAAAIGVPTPDSWCAESGLALGSWASTQRYPIVIKPRRSLVTKGDTLVNTGGIQFVFSFDELQAKVREIEDPICQAVVRGTGCGFFALCKKGEVIIKFAHRRLHEVRATGGPSSLRMGIHDEMLETVGSRLLQSLEWDGVAMVEFKRSETDDQLYLMEVNGRFWGSLPLALLSGVDFPWLYYQLLIGKPIPPQEPYPPGIVSRWWVGEISYLLDELNLIRKDPAKPYVSKWAKEGRMRILSDFLRWACRLDVKDDLFLWRDPLPFVMDIICQLSKVVH